MVDDSFGLPRYLTGSPLLVPRPSQSYGFNLDSAEREGEESTAKQRPGEEARERREEAPRAAWDRRTPTDDRKKRREDSEPRLYAAGDDNQDGQEPADNADKSGTLPEGFKYQQNKELWSVGLLLVSWIRGTCRLIHHLFPVLDR